MSGEDAYYLRFAESVKADRARWEAFQRVIGRRGDLALRVYALLLESRAGVFTEDLAKSVGSSSGHIWRVLLDLEKLGLVHRESRVRGRARSNYWLVDKPVVGLLRLIPVEYFSKGIPEDLSRKVTGEEWLERFKGLAEWFVEYTGLPWLMSRELTWRVERDGMMQYTERRGYVKLGETVPPVVYSTLFMTGDRYSAEVFDGKGERIECDIDIFRHKLGVMNIVNVRVPREIVDRAWKGLRLGDHFTIEIKDTKRLYACPTDDGRYMACFPYLPKEDNVHELKLNYEFSPFLGPLRCGIWIDRSEVIHEIDLTEGGDGAIRNFVWAVEREEGLVSFELVWRYLLREGRELKLLFELKPQYRSDYERWLRLEGARGCPFCGRVPLELVRPS